MIQIFLIFVCVCFYSCEKESDHNASHWQEISGRDAFPQTPYIQRYPVYRAKIPSSWKREDLPSGVSLSDTTKPLCTFLIDDINGQLKITVHNFPSDSLEERILPEAQIQRWKGQFESLHAASINVIPQAYGGFSGYFFEGRGILKGEETMMMGWSMQLGQEQYQALQLNGSEEEKRFFKQMRADYTLKVTGKPEIMEKHQQDIVRFARSFELIQAIPSEI